MGLSKLAFTIFGAAVRVVCLAYVAMSVVGFFEARKLLSGGYELRGDKLYIPLEICQPSSINVDGTIISVDSTDIGQCNKMEYLVHACAMSMICSGVAVLIYVIVDALLRFGRGPFKKSTIAGMGLFLIFILLQTAVCVWALWNQARFWVDYFNDVYDAMGADNQYGIKTVYMHASTWLLFTTGLSAIVTAAGVLIDAIISLVMLGRADTSEEEVNRKAVSKHMESFSSHTDEGDGAYASGSLDEQPKSAGGPAWSQI